VWHSAGPQTTAPRSMVCFEDESVQTWSGQIARWITVPVARRTTCLSGHGQTASVAARARHALAATHP